MTYLETANAETVFFSRRAAVSAVRRAARSRGANQLVGAFGLPAPAAPDATAARAAAGTGGAAAGGDGPARDETRQQPGQHWRHHPSTQHSNCQHRHCGRKQSLVLVPQLPVPISTVSGVWPVGQFDRRRWRS